MCIVAAKILQCIFLHNVLQGCSGRHMSIIRGIPTRPEEFPAICISFHRPAHCEQSMHCTYTVPCIIEQQPDSALYHLPRRSQVWQQKGMVCNAF
jgi:hypothetical protein